MRIGILGPLLVRDAAGRPVEVGGRRLRALLVRLAVDAGRPISAARLLDDLWDGDPPGGNALQALVSRLRGAAGRDVVEHGPGGYRLGVDPGEVDAVAFERAVAAARRTGDPARRSDDLRRALDLWRGPALADVAGDDFARPAIARLDELRLAAVEDRLDADRAAARPVPPPAELAAAAANPLRERLRAHYVRSLHAAGRRAEALEAYEETRRALADRLGADPSPELAAAHLAILRDETTEPAEPAEPGGPAAPPPRRTNLPAQLTTFVGREDESRRVGELLREHRLVTLTGPGGAGKTRLAGEIAAGHVADTPDGVWFVPLAPVSDPGDLLPAVLTGLGVVDTAWTPDGRPAPRPLERLTDYLAAKSLVLVLDNCEHLVDAVARLADHLLGRAPGVRILATSREPLGITGESLCPVPSLPLPPPGPDGEPPAPDEALRYASVRLFADRAAAVRPGFAVDAATAADVVEICRALDGVPLAIELAAARLRALTPGQVAARLGDRFRLLSAGSRAALPRHRTLRAVVDWSWDLLDDVERTVLRRLSVFAGGAAPDAAARVCGLDAPDAPHPDDVLDVIAALIDKSLVLADGGADVRYRLLETVRVYAGERLEEAGEAGRVRAEYTAHFLGLAERAEPELRRADQLVWVERLAAERGNLSAALRHAVDVRDAGTALRLFGSLIWFWFMRDMEIEAGGFAAAVHDLAADAPPPDLVEQHCLAALAAALFGEFASARGTTATSLRTLVDRLVPTVPETPRHPILALVRPLHAVFAGDMERARDRLQALDRHPDPWLRAVARVMLGHIAINVGDIDAAEAEANVGCDRFRELGDRWGLLGALGCLMQVHMARGDLEGALRRAREAQELGEAGIGLDAGIMMRVFVGEVRIRSGDYGGARKDFELAMEAMERRGDFADAGTAALALCELSLWEGDRAAARELAERVHTWTDSRRSRPDVGLVARRVHMRLGCLAEEDGDLDAAARWHARALDGLQNDVFAGNPTLAVLAEGLAALAAASGEHSRAAEFLGTVHTLRGYRDDGTYDGHRVAESAARALGDAAFAAAYRRGRAVGRDAFLARAPVLAASVRTSAPGGPGRAASRPGPPG
ncbi:BTAD domain-containing putative transcriptional regulator [Actinomadura algeriensis]|uniref:ATPase/DNA-binding SARP family transcriptional activator n=1 Tax=Actinomadura algeriensis TaxID=1679523 RepID=A0ABR9K5B8_9ACTN|nr:BTAD domain-containing putative transcriptional regulator [Actinomadura algeriensis]MBE1538002.1 putative ATPase/DNA-binding SARP family transcriptional activator [Actinomadura algeriensis]